MQHDLISIILPVYNCEKYIAQTLESLINQTYDNLEVICINDGSTDSSPDIIHEFSKRDARIKLFSQENKGPAASRNLGLEKSCGEYIMFCDSDDWYEINMCEKMHSTITRQNVNLVMCAATFHYEKNIYREYGGNYEENIAPLGTFKASDILLKPSSALLWHKIFKKSIIDKYNIIFPNGLESDDTLFCYEYLCVCQTCCGIKDKLYNYRLRQNSIMDKYVKRQNIEVLYDRIRFFEYFNQFLKINNLENKLKNCYNYFFAKQFLICYKTLEGDEEKEKLLELTKKYAKNAGFAPSKNNIISIVLSGASLKKVEKYIKNASERKKIFGDNSLVETIKRIFISAKKYYTYYKI